MSRVGAMQHFSFLMSPSVEGHGEARTKAEQTKNKKKKQTKKREEKQSQESKRTQNHHQPKHTNVQNAPQKG